MSSNSTSFESLGIDFTSNAPETGVILDQFGNVLTTLVTKIDKFANSSEQLNKIKADGIEKQAVSAQNLIDKINRLVETYGMGQTELLRYDAAQRGVTEQTEAQIAELGRLQRATLEMQAMQARDIELNRMRQQASKDYIKFWEQEIAAQERATAEALAMAEKEATELQAINERRDAQLATIRGKEQADYIKWWEGQIIITDKMAEKEAIAELKWVEYSAAKKLELLQKRQTYQTNPAISQGTINSLGIPSSVSSNASSEMAKYAKEVEEAEVASKGFQVQTARATNELVTLGREFGRGNYSRMPGSFSILAQAMGATIGPITLLIAATAALTYEMAKGAIEIEDFEKHLILTGNLAALNRDSLNAMANALSDNVTGGVGKAKETLEGLASTGKFSAETLQVVAQASLNFQHLSGENADKANEMFAKMSEGVADWALKTNDSYHFLTISQYDHIKLLEEEGKKQEAMTEAANAFVASTDDHTRKVGTLVQWYREWGIAIDKITNGLKEMGAGPTDNTKLNSLLKIALAQQDAYQAALKVPESRRLSSQTGEIKYYENLVAQINKILKDGSDKRLADQRDADSKVIQAQAIHGEEANEALQRQIRTQEQKRLDAYAETESTAVERNAGALDEQLKAHGVYYSELIKQAKDTDAKEVAQTKLSGEYRVNAKKNEFAKQLELAQQYGVNLLVNGQQLAAQQAAAADRFHDRRGGQDPALTNLRTQLDAAKDAFKSEDQIYKDRLNMLDDYHNKELISDTDYYAGRNASRKAELAALNAEYMTELSIFDSFVAKTKEQQAKVAEMRQKAAADYAATKHILSAQDTKDRVDQSDPTKFTKDTNKILIDARSTIESGDALLKYGNAAKQSALELAQLEIQKAKLNPLTQAELINNRLSAAELKDIGTAYIDLAKNYEAALRVQEARDAIAASGVIGYEQAKVVAAKASAEKRIKYEFHVAEMAILAARASNGGATPEQEEAFAKAKKLHDELTKLTQKEFVINLKLAGFDDVANQFKSLGESAGKLGQDWQGASTALSGIGDALAKYAKIEKEERETGLQFTAQKIGAYGDMADAAKNFFGENTAGYKTMEGVAKAFHVVQMAMQLEQMAQGAVAAVINQAQGDPYSAWARMAAMAAAMAALGFAVSGGFNSGGAGETAAQAQQLQGTGTVLGAEGVQTGSLQDRLAKVGDQSKSIDNALKDIKDNSKIGLTYSQQMVTALNSIDASMSGLANLVAQTYGITSGNSVGVQEGTLSKNRGDPILKMIGINDTGLGQTLAKIIDPIFGSKIVNAVQGWFGKTTQNITDSGLSLNGTIHDIGNGQGVGQYTNVDKTTSSFWGIVKDTSQQRINGSVDPALNQQFSLIFKGLEDSLSAAATALGRDGNAVKQQLDSFVVKTDISLRDLKGQALTDAINTVISSVFDQAAGSVLSGMKDFQKVGEGYYETVIRVASGVESAKAALENLGVTAINFTDIINKQGDVATELVRQSVIAKETLSYNTVHHDAQTVTSQIQNPQSQGMTSEYNAGGAYTTITKTIPAYDTVTAKLSGIGEIMQNLSGTADDLIKAYTQLLDVQKKIGDVGNGNNLTTSMIQGAGSLDALSSGLDSYFQNFFTDAEQTAAKTSDLQKQFAALNVPMPDTIAGFRSLINSLDLSSDSGQKLYGQLITLSGAFYDVKKSAADAANSLVSGFQTAKNSIDSYLKSLEGSINGSSTSSTHQQLLDTMQKVHSSNAQTSLDGLNSLQSASQSYLDAVKNSSSSPLEYTRAVAEVMNDLKDAQSQADNQISIAQKQLDQLTNISNTATTIQSLLQTASPVKVAVKDPLVHSFDVGTNYVPYDMVAKVHQGEAIIPRADNRAIMDRLSAPLSDAHMIVTAIKAMHSDVRSGHIAMIKNTSMTARLLKRWEGNGMPEIRTLT